MCRQKARTYIWGMNQNVFRTLLVFPVFMGIGCTTGILAQGPTLLDAVEVVEGSPTDTVMVAEWYVTNATENAMTLYVERNVLQVVDPMNLPYEAGAEGAYERFCWGGTCYPYGTGSSALPLALTLEPMEKVKVSMSHTGTMKRRI